MITDVSCVCVCVLQIFELNGANVGVQVSRIYCMESN